MLSVYLLQISNFFSGLSNALVVITIPWLVLEVTGSPAFAGFVVAVSSLPGLLISPFSGLLVNRFGNRAVSIGADVFSTLSVIAFPIAAMTIGLSGVVILVIALVGAIFDPVGYTARKTLIKTVADASGVNIEKLNGIHEGLFGVSWIAGPAVGALLISLIGAENSFWVAGAGSAIAAISILLIRKVSISNQGDDADTEQPHFLLGFRLIWGDRLIRAIMLSVIVLAMVYLPTESVVLPTYYEGLNNPAALGIVISVISAGSTITAFSYGWLVEHISGRLIIRTAYIGASLGVLAMSFLPSLPLMLLGAALLGLSWGPFNPFMNTLVQTRVAEPDHGMVYGAQTALFYAAPPIGMVLTGYAIEDFGLQPAYHGLAVLLLVTTIFALISKPLREKF